MLKLLSATVALSFALSLLVMTIVYRLGTGSAPVELTYVLAFVSNRAGQNDIYLAQPDGHVLQRITYTPAREQYLAWQPGGNQLAFVAQPAYQNPHHSRLQVITLPAATPRDLVAGFANYLSPAWVPGGRGVLYSAEIDRPYRVLYRITDARTTASEALLDLNQSVFQFTWAPDKSSLLLTVAGDSLDLVWHDFQTGQTETLLATSDSESQPAISPNGNQLAYVRFREGKSEIYVYDMVESSQIYNTGHNAYTVTPQWSPDGRWIYYSTNKDGNFELYRMQPDGSNRQNLTNHPADDTFPTFSDPFARSSNTAFLVLISLLAFAFSSQQLLTK